MHTEFDVAVIGLGAMGSMALWQLAEDGLNVVGFEQFGIGHDRGAVGGESRLFRRMQTSGPEYNPVIDMARSRWENLQEFSDVQILTETGGLMIGRPGDSRMVAAQVAAEKAGLEMEYLSGLDMENRFPEHLLDQGEIGMFDSTQGYIRCEQAVLTAVARARHLGAQVRDYSKISIKHASAEGVVMTDGQNEWTAKKAIVTTGSWSGDNLPSELRDKSRAGRIKLTWFSPLPGHDFSAENFPVFQRLVDDGTLYGAPSLDGGGSVKIAPGGAPTHMAGPDDYFRGQTVDEIQDMERHVARYFPGLSKSPIRACAWTDFYVDDWIPFLGFLPRSESVLLANGFAGFGFKMCPGIGRIAADMVQGKKDRKFQFMEPTRSIGSHAGKA
ncbi:FAD-dependent oxidoreductase [Arthrobacter sp. R4-81]